MKKSFNNLIKCCLVLGALMAVCAMGGKAGKSLGTLTAYATMDLETGAPVSGISVALNNYYARTANPEKGLAETVKQAASNTIVVDDGMHNSATVKLVASVVPKEEEIVTDNGVTFGTVTGTNNLRLREEPNSDGRTLTLLTQGEHYVITGQEGDFFKVQIDDDLEGYVFKDYIDTTIRYDDEVLTPEEKAAKEAESARLKKEAEEAMKRLEEAKAESKAAEESQKAEEDAKKETKKGEKTEETTKAKETKAKETKAKETTKAEETTKAKETTKAAETTKAKETTKAAETTKAKETTKASGKSETVEAPPTSGGNSGTVSAPTSDNKEAVTVEEIDDNIKEAEISDEDEEDEEEEEEEDEDETEKETAKSSSSGPGSVTSATRSAIVAFAKQYLGGTYVYGGTDLDSGVDCSGFTQQIYKNFGYSIGRSSRDQAAKGREITLSQAQPGDLLFYDSDGYINHVAMYIGNGQVIHASSSTTGIIISNAQYRTPCKVCSFLD